MNLKFFCCLPVVAVVGLVNSAVASPSLQCDASRYNIGIKIKSPLFPSIVTEPWNNFESTIYSDWPTRPAPGETILGVEIIIQGPGVWENLIPNCDFYVGKDDPLYINSYGGREGEDMMYLILQLTDSSVKSTDESVTANFSVIPKINKTGITRTKKIVFKLH